MGIPSTTGCNLLWVRAETVFFMAFFVTTAGTAPMVAISDWRLLHTLESVATHRFDLALLKQ
jgi:hypothetical protein